MAIFILPTTGNTAYRGKYPNRARSISGTAGRGTGRHIELMDGTRLWSGDDKTPEYSAGSLSDDYSKVRASAVPMSAAQYATLREAAELSRSVVGVAGHGRRARIDEGVRALVDTIKPDARNYAKRNAEAARRDTLAGETGRGFDAARPFRVRNKTPQFSGSFDFATLAEARDYLAAQIARRDSVVSGAAPVGPDANAQCPMDSFILWADGTETMGDMGWTPPADGGRRWNAPAPVSPATAEPAETVRRDNVEYHAGRAAFVAGVPLADCPYLAGGDRAARWTLGWNEADNRPHIIAGRSVDGTEYLTGMGWSGDYRAALVMSPADAREIAAREEKAAALTRSPDNGTYQIKAHVWSGPRLYTVAEYEADAAEAARMAEYLAQD